MWSFLFHWQLSSQLSCASYEILSELILRIILSILVNLEVHLAEVFPLSRQQEQCCIDGDWGWSCNALTLSEQ